MSAKHTKIWYFDAEIVKVGLILTVVACTSGNLVIQVQHEFSFKKSG